MAKLLCVLAFVMPSGLFAQLPQIYNRGILNAASFMPAGLPAGSIARGSLFSIFGTHMGPNSSPTLTFPLSTTLGGTTVQVTQGSTTVNAIPVFVSPGQINAIMPSNAPLGTVSVYVSFNSIKSPPARATVSEASFGILSINGAGFGPGVLQNSISATNTPVNLPSLPAQPGQVMILYGTGLGAVAADNVAPTAGTPTTKVEVFVGGQTASVGYSGRSPCCSGLDEVVFTVPSSAPLGCWVPVQIRTSGTTVSNTTTMAISADGSPCSDSANALTASFLAGKKIGLIGLLRTDVTEDVGLAKSGQVTTDAAMLTFQQENPLPAAPFNAILSLPPPGSCTAYSAAGDLFDGDPLPGADDSGAEFLNAGTPLTISSAAGQRSLGRPAGNARNFQPLGYTYTGSLVPSSLLLNAGNLTLSAPGGADVGPFQAAITVPSAFELTWTNQPSPPAILTINRSQGLTVNWSGAPAGQPVIIFGGGVDLPSNSSGVFACVAPAGSSSFTVPAIALGNIPATRRNLLQSKGVVYVGALPASNPTMFTASGLDVGAIVTGAFAGRTVVFQ
jgi:uncharacterized protein (TIGR03437 family)